MSSPRATVVWVSIDGFRPDYVDRADTPVLDRLVREGAFTRAMTPTFPSMTFPVHVSMATGVPVDRHGIPSNAFYDRRRGRSYRYPPWAGMVESEAIWNAAARQGLRAAVQDWPVAHAQQGSNAAAYFNERFDSGLSDAERLDALLRVWREDHAPQPLRLLVTWIGELDSAGHQFGPDSEAMVPVIERTDALLGDFLDRVEQQWRNQAAESDVLYLFLTTDHGMSPVHTLVNLNRLCGVDSPRSEERVVILTSGNIGHVYFMDTADAAFRQNVERALVDGAEALSGLRIFTPQNLPTHWRYAHPHRTGDWIAVLDTGFTFSARPGGVVAPVEEFGGPFGMHGYDPDTDPNMMGFSVFWRTPHPIGGQELDAVHGLQLFPTIARLLGLEPVPDTMMPPLTFAP